MTYLSERRDSNPRPRPWQGHVLPTILLSHCGPSGWSYWCRSTKSTLRGWIRIAPTSPYISTGPKTGKESFIFSYLNRLPVCQSSLLYPEPPWFLLQIIYKWDSKDLNRSNKKFFNFFVSLLIQSFQSTHTIKKSHPCVRMTLIYCGVLMFNKVIRGFLPLVHRCDSQSLRL